MELPDELPYRTLRVSRLRQFLEPKEVSREDLRAHRALVLVRLTAHPLDLQGLVLQRLHQLLLRQLLEQVRGLGGRKLRIRAGERPRTESRRRAAQCGSLGPAPPARLRRERERIIRLDARVIVASFVFVAHSSSFGPEGK